AAKSAGATRNSGHAASAPAIAEATTTPSPAGVATWRAGPGSAATKAAHTGSDSAAGAGPVMCRRYYSRPGLPGIPGLARTMVCPDDNALWALAAGELSED